MKSSLKKLKKKDWNPVVRQALEEDLGKNGDVTGSAIFSSKEKAVFTLFAKDDGVLCGIDAFAGTFAELSKKCSVDAYFSDGAVLAKGTVVARVRGPVAAILAGERTALNIVSHLSGIATKTAEFAAASGGKPVVLDTRKTIPGLRVLQKYAVATGGGSNHRMGLFDMVLIKDNHIDAAGGIANAVNKVRAHWGNRFKIEVETRNLDEVREALSMKVDRIMLDNMTNDLMAEAVSIIAGRAETEASGNMTIERLRSLAGSGIDFVSFGELTHTVRALDFSLKEESLG